MTSIFKDDRKVKIKKETQCSKCVHVNLCFTLTHNSRGSYFKDVCINYNFGTSAGQGCQSCLNRFTRWDGKDSLPCFRCKFFRRK